MGVATGDVGVVASHLLHTMHASWPFICQKTNVYVIISTRKNSVIITEKTLFEMHQYDVKNVTITWQFLLWAQWSVGEIDVLMILQDCMHAQATLQCSYWRCVASRLACV